MLLGLSFDPDILFEERLTAQHQCFLAFLKVVEEYLPASSTAQSRIGRPCYDDEPFFRAYLAKHIYQIDKISLLRQRLHSNNIVLVGYAALQGFLVKQHFHDGWKTSHKDTFPKPYYPSWSSSFTKESSSGSSHAIRHRYRHGKKPATKRRLSNQKKTKRGRPRKDEVR